MSVRARAIDLVQEAVAAGWITGQPPSTVAAAAVYLAARAAGLGRTQRDVAAAPGTTDTTIRPQARALEAGPLMPVAGGHRGPVDGPDPDDPEHRGHGERSKSVATTAVRWSTTRG